MLRVTTTWTAPQGGPYITLWHTAGQNAADALDAVNAVGTFLGNVDTEISTAYGWTTSGIVEVIDPQTGQITGQFVVTGTFGVGASTGQPLPFTTQGLYRWLTGFFQNGRQVRGRTSIPGLTENASQGGKPDAAFVTTMQGKIAAFLADFSPGNEFSIWSPAAGTVTHVNAGSFWDQWAVLRSRRD